eukprot:scaffold452868_cov47-Prasinocladus_malaysianus.AAC.1
MSTAPTQVANAALKAWLSICIGRLGRSGPGLMSIYYIMAQHKRLEWQHGNCGEDNRFSQSTSVIWVLSYVIHLLAGHYDRHRAVLCIIAT